MAGHLIVAVMLIDDTETDFETFMDEVNDVIGVRGFYFARLEGSDDQYPPSIEVEIDEEDDWGGIDALALKHKLPQ